MTQFAYLQQPYSGHCTGQSVLSRICIKNCRILLQQTLMSHTHTPCCYTPGSNNSEK